MELAKMSKCPSVSHDHWCRCLVQDTPLMLAEDNLRQVAKDASTIFNTVEAPTEAVVRGCEDTLKNAIRIAYPVDISGSYRAAACNVICAFLEGGVYSQHPALRSIFNSRCLWFDVLRIYLDRFDIAKGKSMRQLLATLLSMLSRSPNPSMTEDFKAYMLTALVDILFGTEAYPILKSAFYALDYLLNGDSISIATLLRTVQSHFSTFSKSEGDNQAWHPSLALSRRLQVCERGKAIPQIETTNGSMTSLEYASELLTHSLLDWVLHVEIASAAGHLLVTIMSKLRNQESAELSYRDARSGTPYWVTCLRRSASKHLEAIETYRYHIFPRLFLLDPKDNLKFLECLNLAQFLEGSFITLSESDTLLLFTALRVLKELGLKGIDASNHRQSRLDIPSEILERLLTHPSAILRFSSLSHIVAFSSSKKIFAEKNLVLLKSALPYFHAETDVGFRAEFFTMIKLFIERLRISFLHLGRELERKGEKPAAENVSKGVQQGKPSISANASLNMLKASFHEHLDFLQWYIGFLKYELLPTSSYQAHITSLGVLTIFLQYGLNEAAFFNRLPESNSRRPWNIQIFSPGMNRVLLDLMLDPFDDVREKTLNILKMSPEGSPYVSSIQEDCAAICPVISDRSDTEFSLFPKAGFVDRASWLMNQTGRADHSDGFARSLNLSFDRITKCHAVRDGAPESSTLAETCVDFCQNIVKQLEMCLQTAGSKQDKAIIGASISGLLISLRLILDRPDGHILNIFLRESSPSPETLQMRVIGCCEQIWDCVRKLLCDDSPEGIIPEEIEDEFEHGTKDRLSYSWRALMDSSCLLRTIVMNLKHIPGVEKSIPITEDLLRIGRLSFVQLAELRHRGAFSSVSQTFAACCRACVLFSDPVLHDMPTVWYQETLSCIHDKASTITRRSAGIPSLITGILSANPSGELFTRGMTDLQSIARAPIRSSAGGQESRLPQVHALNCLKDIFMSSKLGQSAEPYVADGLDIAVCSLESQIWAIRNCGVMLYKALIDRIFGNNAPEGAETGYSTRSTSRMSWDRAPELGELLPRLLNTGSAPNQDGPVGTGSRLSVEAIFPALELFRRAGPPPGRYDLARDAVAHHLGSKVWLVRAMSARTFNSLIQDKDGIEEISRLFQSSYMSQNELHGRLLAVKHLIGTILMGDELSATALRRLLDVLHTIQGIMSAMKSCSINVALYLDIMNIVATKYLEKLYSQSRELLKTIVCCLRDVQLLNSTSHNSNGPIKIDNALLNRSTLLNRSLCSIAEKDIQALRELIMSVSVHDPNATRMTLLQLSSLHCWAFAKEVTREDWCQVAELYTKLKSSSTVADVKEIATSNLAELLEAFHWIGPRIVTGFVQEDPSWLLNWELSDIAQSPALADAELRLRGSILAAWCSEQRSWDEKLERRLNIWVHMLKEACDEKSDFPTRKAAVQSLLAFSRVFRPLKEQPNTRRDLLGAYLVLYDTLNDDDEEIRDMGARIVSYIFSDPCHEPPNVSLIPLAASHRFSQWLGLSYNQSPSLCTNALSRLIGPGAVEIKSHTTISSNNISLAPPLIPVSLLLSNARKLDTALFAEEKQNLFVNSVKEAEMWCCVLKQLSQSAIGPDIVSRLSDWTLQGVGVLACTAENEIDGPLGWTAKSEVFTLGMRVIFAAEVLTCWARKEGVEGALVGTVDVIGDGLKRFVDVGRRNAVHELWLERAEKVIAQHVEM